MEFLENYHIQGKINCKIRLGLFYNDELVSILGFRKNKEKWDLSRFTSKYKVIGGFSKLLKYFIKEYNVKNIYTFADLRYSDNKNNLYLINGFNEINLTKPNYYYFRNGLERYSRIKFQKHKLKNKLKIFDSNLSEVENMYNNGYYRIFDCGNIKYELKL